MKVENYSRFLEVVKSTAKKHILGGFRKSYIPGWNDKAYQLHKEFLESGSTEVADELLHCLDETRKIFGLIK